MEGPGHRERHAERGADRVPLRQALEAQRHTGQETGETPGPEQAVIRPAGYREHPAVGQPFRQGRVLARAQVLERVAVDDDRAHSVVSRPVFGEAFHARVQHSQATTPRVVEVVEVGIAAEHQEHVGVGDAGTQVEGLAGNFSSTGKNSYINGIRETLHVNRKVKALAGVSRQLKGTAVDVGEGLPIRPVSARHSHFEMSVQVRAAVVQRHGERRPASEAIGAGETQRGLNVHRGAGSHPRDGDGGGLVRRSGRARRFRDRSR